MASALLESCRCLGVTLTSTQKYLGPKNSMDDIKQIKQTVVGRLNFQQLSEKALCTGVAGITGGMLENAFPLQSSVMADHGTICKKSQQLLHVICPFMLIYISIYTNNINCY